MLAPLAINEARLAIRGHERRDSRKGAVMLNPQGKRSAITRNAFLLSALAAALAIAAFATMAAVVKGGEMRAGSLDGFSLNGCYSMDGEATGGSLYVRASFLEEESGGYDGRWQLYGDSVVNGRYRKTFDPNVFDLYDEDGNPGGTAHLAYTSTGTEGLIYIDWKGDGVVFPKRENQPVFVRD